jgi:beta-xylosidase/AraC-like DNA-binding protein
MAKDAYEEQNRIEIFLSDDKSGRRDARKNIELLYVLEGTVDITIEGKKKNLHNEDVLLVNADKYYTFCAEGTVLMSFFTVSYELITDILHGADILFLCDSTTHHDDRFKNLTKILKELINNYLLHTKKTYMNFYHISLCYQLLDCLTTQFLVTKIPNTAAGREKSIKYKDRIHVINNYLYENYKEPLSLQNLADELNLTTEYISRFFKKVYGMTFLKYLSNIRLYHAVEELLNTNSPITRIIYDNGFANIAIFNKTFKSAYGMTPFEYRSRLAESSACIPSTGETAIQKKARQILPCNSEKQQLSETFLPDEILVENTELIFPVWNQMINIGTAAELLQAEVREHIIILHHSLQFTYVRFWNIFPTSMFINDSTLNGYNFLEIDHILDFLIHEGMKPFIELGPKQKRIQKNTDTAIISKTGSVDYTGTEKWKNILSQFMQHILSKYGSNEIASWRMELWYNDEEDNPISVSEYLSKFSETRNIIKSYSPETKFGGGGFKTGTNEDVILQCLQLWQKAKQHPEFISIMNYPYVLNGSGNSSRRSINKNFLSDYISKTRNDMNDAGFSCADLYVTEWNLTISDRNFINDSCFKAAYIVRNMIENYSSAAVIGYFSGTDRCSEYFDSDKLLFGGTGLLTKDSIIKPSGFAFEFLNKLYPCCAGKGTNYIVTTDMHDNYGILCYNEQNLGSWYYASQEDRLDKSKMQNYFETYIPLDISIILHGVQDGTYKITVYRVNEQYGNILGLWKDIAYSENPGTEETAYLQQICIPNMTVSYTKIMHKTAHIHIHLEPNEITFYRMTKGNT